MYMDENFHIMMTYIKNICTLSCIKETGTVHVQYIYVTAQSYNHIKKFGSVTDIGLKSV